MVHVLPSLRITNSGKFRAVQPHRCGAMSRKRPSGPKCDNTVDPDRSHFARRDGKRTPRFCASFSLLYSGKGSNWPVWPTRTKASLKIAEGKKATSGARANIGNPDRKKARKIEHTKPRQQTNPLASFAAHCLPPPTLTTSRMVRPLWSAR
jgi:hypothetical protein